MRSHLFVMVSRTLLAACLAVSLTVFVWGVPAQAVTYDVTTTITAAQNLTNVCMILAGAGISQNPINITAGGPTTCDFYFNVGTTGSIQGPYTIMGLYHDAQGDHVAVGLNLNTALWALDVAGSPPTPLDWATVFPSDQDESTIASALKSRPGLLVDLLITGFFGDYNIQYPPTPFSPKSIDYFAGLSDPIYLVGFSTATDVGSAQITNITPVPLPPTVLLLGSSLLGLAGWRRFRKS